MNIIFRLDIADTSASAPAIELQNYTEMEGLYMLGSMVLTAT